MFRIIHFSDIHVSAPLGDMRGLLDKRVIGFANSFLCRGRAYDRSLIQPAAEKMLSMKPDAIVFSGDAATCGQPEEFKIALEKLSPLVESGVPIIFSPGNHDAYTHDRASAEALENFTRSLSHGKRGLGDMPFAMEFEECSIGAVNASHPTCALMSSGTLDTASNAFLSGLCEKKTKPLIAVCHFPVRRIRRGLINGFRHRMFGTGNAVRLLDEGKIDLVLCGHIHRHYADLDASGRGETSSGSLTRFGEFSVIDLENGMFKLKRVCTTD